jgi:hypothetical protein
MDTADPAARLQALQDRLDVTDALIRYSMAVDSLDYAALRDVLADDIWAQYGNAAPVTDADTLVAWIENATKDAVWQHHQLAVYEVSVEGDRARTLSYLTSYQVFKADPSTAVLLVARYHDELRRGPGGWKLSRRTMELLWGEPRADQGFLARLGGRGPHVEGWQRD